MNRGQLVAVVSSGMVGCTVVLLRPSAALACYGIPCSPTICVADGLPGNHSSHSVGPTGGATAGGAPTSILPVSKNLSLLAQMPLASIGGGSGSSLYGWTDP